MLKPIAGVLGVVRGGAVERGRQQAAGGACPRVSPWRCQPESDCLVLGHQGSAGWKVLGSAAQRWGPALSASAAVFSSSAVVIKQMLRKGRFDRGHAREGQVPGGS